MEVENDNQNGSFEMVFDDNQFDSKGKSKLDVTMNIFFVFA